MRCFFSIIVVVIRNEMNTTLPNQGMKLTDLPCHGSGGDSGLPVVARAYGQSRARPARSLFPKR